MCTTNYSDKELFELPEISISFSPVIKPSQRYKVTNSKDSYNLFMKRWDMNKLYLVEEMYVMFLNRANSVLGILPLSSGGYTGTVAELRLILVTALKGAATGIILAHNHPSGNTKPSMADEQITKKLKEAASYHDIKVLDHIIVSEDSYLSFADEGLL
jgi:DNA repair protein RadC